MPVSLRSKGAQLHDLNKPMKDIYFSPTSIQQKSLEMLQRVAEYKRGNMPPFTPQVSALLILDMQKYFLEPSSHACVPSAAAILPNLKALIDAYARQSAQ